MSDAVTTMRDVDLVAAAVARLRTAMDHLADPGDWTVVDGGIDLRSGATRVVVSHDEPSHSIDVSVEGTGGKRMACLRHILPTETQLEIAAREPRPAHVLALLAPMVRIASIAMHREPSSIPLDVDALSSMCSRFASACLAEGHVLEYVEVRPWIDGMTRMSGHLPDGSTVEPTPSARAVLTEGWRTAVEIDVHGYATTESRRAMMPPRGAPGIYLTICPQGGLMVEDVATDVVTAMRWAAEPPAPSPMFTVREADPSPLDGLWE